jgi:hypothetical protein
MGAPETFGRSVVAPRQSLDKPLLSFAVEGEYWTSSAVPDLNEMMLLVCQPPMIVSSTLFMLEPIFRPRPNGMS